MWIMVAGPYTHGSEDPKVWKQNLTKMNEAAYEIFKKGHQPVIGVNMALPIIEAAGKEHFNELMMPISLELASRCDAILRIGGPSKGADQEVEVLEKRSAKTYYSVHEIPDTENK